MDQMEHSEAIWEHDSPMRSWTKRHKSDHIHKQSSLQSIHSQLEQLTPFERELFEVENIGIDNFGKPFSDSGYSSIVRTATPWSTTESVPQMLPEPIYYIRNESSDTVHSQGQQRQPQTLEDHVTSVRDIRPLIIPWPATTGNELREGLGSSLEIFKDEYWEDAESWLLSQDITNFNQLGDVPWGVPSTSHKFLTHDGHRSGQRKYHSIIEQSITSFPPFGVNGGIVLRKNDPGLDLQGLQEEWYFPSLTLQRLVELLEYRGVCDKLVACPADAGTSHGVNVQGGRVVKSSKASRSKTNNARIGKGRQKDSSSELVTNDQDAVDQANEQEERLYGCPFSKHNPPRYATVHGPCIDYPGFKGLKRVTEHLKRNHSTKDRCPFCKQSWSSLYIMTQMAMGEELFEEHRTRCERLLGHEKELPEPMTLTQEQSFYGKEYRGPRAWTDLYQDLFPDEFPIPSPWYDYLTLTHTLHTSTSGPSRDVFQVLQTVPTNSDNVPQESGAFNQSYEQQSNQILPPLLDMSLDSASFLDPRTFYMEPNPSPSHPNFIPQSQMENSCPIPSQDATAIATDMPALGVAESAPDLPRAILSWPCYPQQLHQLQHDSGYGSATLSEPDQTQDTDDVGAYQGHLAAPYAQQVAAIPDLAAPQAPVVTRVEDWTVILPSDGQTADELFNNSFAPLYLSCNDLQNQGQLISNNNAA